MGVAEDCVRRISLAVITNDRDARLKAKSEFDTFEKLFQAAPTGALSALYELHAAFVKEGLKGFAAYKIHLDIVRRIGRAEAKRRKSEHTSLLIYAFGGAALFVGIGTLIQAGNDLILLALALVGLLLGYFVGNLIQSWNAKRG